MYAIEGIWEQGMFLLNPKSKHVEQVLVFEQQAEAEAYLWNRDALITMTMRVVDLDAGTG